jgi:hypothetical protein
MKHRHQQPRAKLLRPSRARYINQVSDSFGLINSNRDDRCSDGGDAFAEERELEFNFSVKAKFSHYL